MHAIKSNLIGTISTPVCPIMGSLGSIPPPPLPEFSTDRHLVYASFCQRSVSNWIECYDPCTNTWTHSTFIPSLVDNFVLKGFAMVSLGSSIYVIGGLLCRKKKSENELPEEFSDVGVEVRSSVLRYDVELNIWSECSCLVVPRYEFACSVCEGKIYVAGGKSSLANAKGISCAEVYDPVRNVWTPLPSMSTLRYKCAGVTWQGKVYVVGGFALKEDSGVTVPFMMERSSAEVYDAHTGKWSHVAGMWQLDVPPNQIVAVDGKLFSSGDCLKAWKGHIEAYDGKLNIWNVVDKSHLQTLSSTSDASNENWESIQRCYLTMAPIGTHLYFLAGYRKASRTMSVVHVFDTSATSDGSPWRSFEPIEEDGEKELCSHCCVVKIS